MLFAEIVKSPQPLATSGGPTTHDLIERYHALINVELQRFKGVEVDKADDYLFASFDGPGRAIRCAVALKRGAAQLGIHLRSGVHTGECELIGDKLGGIATSIAAWPWIDLVEE
jgi:class 3 adenylate cyclase